MGSVASLLELGSLDDFSVDNAQGPSSLIVDDYPLPKSVDLCAMLANL